MFTTRKRDSKSQRKFSQPSWHNLGDAENVEQNPVDVYFVVKCDNQF